MNDSNKREFLAALVTIGAIYDQSPQQVKAKSPVYWAALSHRSIEDIKGALNAHVRDTDRGRFFPKPADIEAQLPSAGDLWLLADEAWAMCPKDELSSAAMCAEMQEALVVAGDLIAAGDMVAARMAFKAAYTRLVDDAIAAGRKPHWYASLGHDKGGRHLAEAKVVEITNRALPPAERKALPTLPQDEVVALRALTSEATRRATDPAQALEHVRKLRQMLSMGARA